MATALPPVIHEDLAGYVQAMEEDGFAYFPKVLSETDFGFARGNGSADRDRGEFRPSPEIHEISGLHLAA